jgi:predicted nucleotidyltransferase
MRRATITLPDRLDDEVERFRAEQAARPSLTSVVEAALEAYLTDGSSATPGDALLARVVRSRPEIRRIAVEHGARTVRLFGSVARGEASSTSDIDLLVDVKPGTTMFDLAALRGEVEDLLGVSVDVVPSSGLDGPALAHILTEALTL